MKSIKSKQNNLLSRRKFVKQTTLATTGLLSVSMPVETMANINGNKKLKKPGKKPVKFKLKNELKKTSNTLIKNKKEPKYKKVYRFDLSGFKKLILFIIFP